MNSHTLRCCNGCGHNGRIDFHAFHIDFVGVVPDCPDPIPFFTRNGRCITERNRFAFHLRCTQQIDGYGQIRSRQMFNLVLWSNHFYRELTGVYGHIICGWCIHNADVCHNKFFFYQIRSIQRQIYRSNARKILIVLRNFQWEVLRIANSNIRK